MASLSPGIISDGQSGKSFFATGLSAYGTFSKDGSGYIWTKASSNSVSKISVEGVMSDKYTIASPDGYGLTVYTLKVDATNNVLYVGGSLYSSTFGTYKTRAFVAKMNIASGVPVLIWMQSLEAVPELKFGDVFYLNFDSSQNVYMAFTEGVSNNDSASLTKYNSSGSRQWTLKISSGVLYNNVRSGNISVDSSQNVFMVYHSYNTNTGEINSFIIKINSSGSVVAHKMIPQAWFSNLCQVMPNGDVLVGSYTDIHVNNSWWLYTQAFVRVNSGLTSIVAQAKINVPNNEQYFPRLGTGPWQIYGDSLYVASWGNLTSSEQTKAYWFKYSTATGTIDIARSIQINDTGTYASGTGFDLSGDSVMMTGYGPTIWFAKLPQDGTGTGTYYANGYKIDYKQVSNISVDSPGYSLQSPSNVSVSSASPTAASVTVSSTSASSVGTPIEKIQRRKIKKKR